MEKNNSLTLSGREFSSEEIHQLRETVHIFRNLSRTELAYTLCEHLDWRSPRGSLKIDSCLKALEKMERLGLIKLSARRKIKSTSQKVECTAKTERQPDLFCRLSSLGRIELQLVSTKEGRDLWNEYVQHYHYLGYKRPFGAHLRYFIVARDSGMTRYLGCLLFSASAWSLSTRDSWIGWDRSDRESRLHLIINNSRYLIFPWIRVKNLSSKILSRVTAQIQDDWEGIYKYRPVLLETFVDSQKYSGTSYRAANWQHIGTTCGRGRMDRHNKSEESVKYIFVYPLVSNFRSKLKQ